MFGIGKFFKKLSLGHKVARYSDKIVDELKDDELIIEAVTKIQLFGFEVGEAETELRIRVADLLPEDGDIVVEVVE